MGYAKLAMWTAVGLSAAVYGARQLLVDQVYAIVLVIMGLYVATHALLIGVETAVYRGNVALDDG